MSTDIQDVEKQVLAERAKRLAEPEVDQDLLAESVSLLQFRTISSAYAINLSAVDAVIRITDIFPVPLTPKHIPGVIRRRGVTTALVNLRFFFYPSMEALIDEDFAIVVVARNKTFALQVEEIDGVFPQLKSGIHPVPESFDKVQSPFISGVTMDGLAILNLEQLLLAEGFGTSRIEG